MTNVALLLAAVDEAFDRKSWHGTNLRGSIRGLRAHEAAWRPDPRRHNIWELVVHSAYWKYAVRRRLVGDERGTFPLGGSNWFDRPEGQESDAQWRRDVTLLAAAHRALREAVAALTSDDLTRTLDGGSLTVRALVSGIAAHDVYHAGQIQLLKRLQHDRPVRRRRP